MMPANIANHGFGSVAPKLEGEILQLTAMRSTKYGSLERYFVALARGCTARGLRMVLQYNEPPHSPRYVDDLSQAGAMLVVLQLKGERVLAACRAVWLIARRRPSVVHLHFCGSLTLIAVGLFARRLGVALVVATVHGLPSPHSRRLARASYARLDRVYCVSRSVERAVLGLGAPLSTLTTRYLGVPDLGHAPAEAREKVREHLTIPSAAPVIGTIAFAGRDKAIDVLVDAFLDHLSTSIPDLHVIIVGVSPAERMLVSPRADRLPARVHWVGIHDDVQPFLAALDVYVQPSRSEGLGLTILEAMRQSLPVVASEVGGIPEVVKDGESGLLVRPDAPVELAVAISRLLADRDLAHRLGEAGHTLSWHKFAMSPSVESTLDDYCAASAPGGHPA